MLNKGSSSRSRRLPLQSDADQPLASGSKAADEYPIGMASETAGATRDASRGHAAAGAPQAEMHPSRAPAVRLLIPVDGTDESQWTLQYALAQHRDRPVEVHLLVVAEPVTSFHVLRFRTQREVAEFQEKIARWLLEDAAEKLRTAGISVRTHFREGAMPNQIVEAAEQLGCGQIVLPSPPLRLLDPLARGLARTVQRRVRSVPVITVNREGFLVPWM